MRIIAGDRKGLRLSSGKSRQIRPTTDSVKEFIFNVVGSNIQSMSVLDIFAGTGSLGIEALSRGAAKAVFVESNHQAHRLLLRNLQKSQYQNLSTLIKLPAKHGLQQLARQGSHFELIFADPPYHRDYGYETLRLVEQYELLSPRGVLVLEQSSKVELVEPRTVFTLMSQRRKGDTLVSFYSYEKTP